MVLPQGRRLALVGSSQGIALSFLISSRRRASLSVLHPLCIDLLVVILVLEYPATFLCARRPRCQGSQFSETAMLGHSRRVTNAPRPNSRKPTVRCHQRFRFRFRLSQNQNSLLSLKALVLTLYEVRCSFVIFLERGLRFPSSQEVMKAYRTRRHLSRGRLKSHRPRNFNLFLPSVLLLLLRIPTPTLLRLQPRLPLTRHLSSSSPLLLVRPSALPKSNLRRRRRLKASPTSPIHLHRLKMRRGTLTLCPRLVKVTVRSSQRPLVLPVRGQQHLRLHARRHPSPLRPRSHRPRCRAHGQTRFLRRPSRTVNRLP
jgi:hypothetical protein